MHETVGRVIHAARRRKVRTDNPSSQHTDLVSHQFFTLSPIPFYFPAT